MKLLLFSDLHCNLDAAAGIVARAADVDVVIGAGDFARQHRDLESTIEALAPITTPTIVVPGNNETAEALERACTHWRAATVLHGGGTRIGDCPFYGLGGGVPVTPFGSWSYDFSEAEAAQLLARCPNGAVLVSHSPPYGCGDVTSLGEHAGSTTVRDVAQRTSARLVVCGHIHDAWGTDEMLGTTRVVNPGPAGMLVEV